MGKKMERSKRGRERSKTRVMSLAEIDPEVHRCGVARPRGRRSWSAIRGSYTIDYCVNVKGEAQFLFNGAGDPLAPGSLFLHPPGCEFTFEMTDEVFNYVVVFSFVHGERYTPHSFPVEEKHKYTIAPRVPFKEGFEFPAVLRKCPVSIQRAMEKIIFCEASNPVGGPRLRDSYLLDLLNLIYATYGGGREPLRPSRAARINRERLARVVEFLARTLDRRISLKEMAQLAAISPSRFRHTFAAVYGASPQNFHMAMRMQEAKKLLAATDMSVKEVSFAMGFEDPNYFSAAFKRCEGVSPSEYIEKITAPI